MSKILIETVNLKKTYQHYNGNITLFNNLNLKIKQGDLVALVGVWIWKIFITASTSFIR